jgi:hypothetical protein
VKGRHDREDRAVGVTQPIAPLDSLTSASPSYNPATFPGKCCLDLIRAAEE